MKTVKINLGDSYLWKQKNKLKDWTCVDLYHKSDVSIDFRKKQVLPFGTNTVDIAFTSHMVEHINDDADMFLFKEIYRILKPNGTVRIVCPDYDKAMDAYKNKNIKFFQKGGVRTIGKTLERMFVNYFASFRKKGYRGIANYSGGPIVKPEEVKKIIATGDRDKIINWCVSKIPKDAPYIAHVNGFNYNKIRLMLQRAGFKTIYKSAYRKSKVPELRTGAFDNRPTVSLYTECKKTVKSHIDPKKHYEYNSKRNLFICPTTGHGYYFYNKNIETFHRNHYRKSKRINRGNDFDKSGNVTNQFHRNRYVICKKRIYAINKYLKKNQMCLDIGAGAGTFGQHLKKIVKKVELLELDPKLAQECKRFNFTTYNISIFAFIPGKKYDLVTAWHVLEHVDNVYRFLMKCKQLSKKYIIIEVPTKRRTPDEYKPKKDFDGHLHYFTIKSMKMLVERCNLKIVEISETKAVQKPAILAILSV